MKKRNITIEDLHTKATEYEYFSCKPTSCSKYKIGTVIDEDKSVRWNREEVERRNLEFENEVKELNRKKNLLYTEFVFMVKTYIVEETNVDENRANKIWGYLSLNYHSYGLHECINHLDELLELFI